MSEVLPKNGLKWSQLEETLLRLRVDDPSWTETRSHSSYWGWPNPGENLFAVAREASNLFYNQMWLGRKALPSGQRLIDDVCSMTREILRAPPEAKTTLTSGGTESIFLAVLAARNFERTRRPQIVKPNIVVPYSSHPAFDKAGHYLGVEVIRTPIGKDGRANVIDLTKAINENTVLIAGATPAYPHGVCDHIPALARLALERDIWLHVDACVGGFLLPFLRRIGEREIPFDFTVAGVRSISADLHKYAYVPRGLSSLTLRNVSDLQYHTFTFSNWPFGDYITEVQAGTRVTSVIASAWTVMKSLGEQGYMELARQLRDVGKEYASGIERIEGLKVFAPPEGGLLVYTSETLNVKAIAEGMIARGVPVGFVRQLPGIHMHLQPRQYPEQVQHYLQTLQAVVESVRSGGSGAKADLSYA